jgi:cell division protein FtsB
MMDALKYAKDFVATADSDISTYAAMAQAYAAIAQAEAAERQATALERIADALEHPNRIYAPDPQDYYSEAEYLAAAERHDYNRFSRPGESYGEYKARISVEPY